METVAAGESEHLLLSRLSLECTIEEESDEHGSDAELSGGDSTSGPEAAFESEADSDKEKRSWKSPQSSARRRRLDARIDRGKERIAGNWWSVYAKSYASKPMIAKDLTDYEDKERGLRAGACTMQGWSEAMEVSGRG